MLPPIFAFSLPKCTVSLSHFAFVVLIMRDSHDYKEDNFNDDVDDDVWTVFCLMLSIASAMQLDRRKKKFLRFSLFLGTVCKLFILWYFHSTFLTGKNIFKWKKLRNIFLEKQNRL